MRKIKTPLLRRAHRGQKGITLIELLIVIAILGVVAGVIIYAVGPFRGAGTLQSANTEAQSVRTAVQAYIAGGGNSTSGTMGPDRTCTNFTPNEDNKTPISYFDGTLKAIYDIDTDFDCIIRDADADFSGGWGSSITWSVTDCEWKKV